MRIRRALALGLLLALATATAACGEGSNANDEIATAGGATPSPSSSTGASSGDEKEQMLKHAQCMRENGVPDFPDPEFQEGGGVNITVPQGTDRAKLEAAEAKCKQYLPNGGEPQKMDPERVEQLRKFAQCMRENGLPDFPDPTDEGLKIEGNNPDMAPDSPKMKAAEEKCRQYQPKGPNGESGGKTKRSDG
ncbi:hypothetical protein K1W54_20190 [Micromonospora sp. CPCC 205371]|nr:hypothetical protein [Micromonospora sp. CPCC 205371]